MEWKKRRRERKDGERERIVEHTLHIVLITYRVMTVSVCMEN